MKKLIVMFFTALFFYSCGENFLDHAPETDVTVGNFYQSQADIEKAVNGVYQGMQPWSVGIYFYLSEVRSNNFWAVFADGQRDWYDISNFSTGSNIATLSNAWANNYSMINRSNEILDRIDNISFTDESLKDRYKAEVRFLRAFAYFQLVKIFNRVPLIDRVLAENEALEISQSQPDLIFEFIVAEMSDVAEQLPNEYDINNLGRVTEQAVKGILARVYLTMAGFPLYDAERLNDARPLLDDIIAMEGSHVTFADNFEDLFAYENDNQFHIFEIQYISGAGAGNALPGQVHPGTPDFQFGSAIFPGRLTVSDDIIGLYEENDLRFDHTIGFLENTYFFNKFTDLTVTIPESGDFPVNFPLLRYADVLLMHAEVENELEGPTPQAVAKLNRIRDRAGLNEITLATQDELRLAIEEERRREFAFEGRYWFDLRRTDRGIDVMNQWFENTGQNIVMSENDYVYPIPLNQLDVFPGLYEQNPGY